MQIKGPCLVFPPRPLILIRKDAGKEKKKPLFILQVNSFNLVKFWALLAGLVYISWIHIPWLQITGYFLHGWPGSRRIWVFWGAQGHVWDHIGASLAPATRKNLSNSRLANTKALRLNWPGSVSRLPIDFKEQQGCEMRFSRLRPFIFVVKLMF